jgi:hypothetical protein
MNSSIEYNLESLVMNYEQLASFEPALADRKRKSIEPIALASGVAVRTLQEFLAFLGWDHLGK